MITLEQILCRCTDEQLESLMSSAQAIMQHFEYVSGHSATYLAGENEQYWKVYGINAMAFTELAPLRRAFSRRAGVSSAPPAAWSLARLAPWYFVRLFSFGRSSIVLQIILSRATSVGLCRGSAHSVYQVCPFQSLTRRKKRLFSRRFSPKIAIFVKKFTFFAFF